MSVIVDFRDRVIRITTGFVQLGVGPYASAGLVRLTGNDGGIRFHNSGGFDVLGLELDGTDQLLIGTPAAANPTTSIRAGTSISLLAASTTALLATTSALTTATPVIAFRSDVLNPIVRQSDIATASATGQPLIVHAQNAIGTTSNGGDLLLRAGTGTTANGSARIQNGTTDRIVVNPTGIGFFGATPVARPNVTGSRADPTQALANLLAALGATSLGLITDSTSP